MGTDERGEEAVAKLHFPGLDPQVVDWLADERSVRMIGLDTPSIDNGPSQMFEAHVRLFERDIPALENVAHLDRLPARGFTVIALPFATSTPYNAARISRRSPFPLDWREERFSCFRLIRTSG